MLVIKSVEKNSIGEELELKCGDKILKFNEFSANDILDYLYFDSQDYFAMLVESDGEELLFEVEKTQNETLGLKFDEHLGVKRCANKCIFCFVDQLPKGMRQTLYCKDDDYRHSFIFGNYITLTNLTKRDLDRIVAYHISPLYISVHATDRDIRSKMLGKKNSDIIKYLDVFAQNNIVVHTQIVLCEGINDGEVLSQTIHTLARYDNIMSLSVVPVGLTDHRDNLYALKPLSVDCLLTTIETVERIHKELKNAGKNLSVFCSDEFYIKANLQVKDYEYYEDFCQIENGVGLVAQFEKNFLDNYKNYDLPNEFDIATSESAYPLICKCADKLRETYNSTIKVHLVKNTYFGQYITVAGLITASDLLKIKDDLASSILFIPPIALLDKKFLDDITLDEVEREMNCKIRTDLFL